MTYPISQDKDVIHVVDPTSNPAWIHYVPFQGSDLVHTTWDRRRRSGKYGGIERHMLGPVPFDGGAEGKKYYRKASESRCTSYGTDLERIFDFFGRHLHNPHIFNSFNVNSAIQYYEQHQKKDSWDEKKLYESLDPAEPLQYFRIVKEPHDLRSENRIYEVAKQLDDLNADQEQNIKFFSNNLALGKATQSNVADWNNTEAPLVCSIPLLWILDLFGRSFKGEFVTSADAFRDPDSQPPPRINTQPSTAAIDTLWNVSRVAYSQYLEKNVNDPNNGEYKKNVKPLMKAGLYAWGAVFKRIGLEKFFGDKQNPYDNAKRTEFLKKLNRVAHYAAVSKSLFGLLERELEHCYLHPHGSEKIYPYHTDIDHILAYPQFLKDNVPEQEQTQAEKTLAQYLQPKIGPTGNYQETGEINPIRAYLLWYKKNVIREKYAKISGSVYEYEDPNFNALSVETDYDQQFYIPEKGENLFVKHILERFEHQFHMRGSNDYPYCFREIGFYFEKKPRINAKSRAQRLEHQYEKAEKAR